MNEFPWPLGATPPASLNRLLSVVDPLDLVPKTFGVVRLGLRAQVWMGQRGLDLIGGHAGSLLAHPSPHAPTPARVPAETASLPRKMFELLNRAILQSTPHGEADLFHQILDQLVPDEARILGALSDGSVSPMVHIYRRTITGGVAGAVLENAALVGRTANVALPRMTAHYVSHLRSFGLLEAAPEDPSLKTHYEILLAETDVLKAIKQSARGPFPARVERQVLQLSGLGAALWEATKGGAT